MPMPRNGFDILAARARMTTDSTIPHRKRWPSMEWLWDELDDLRANTKADYAALEKELKTALDERNALRNKLDDMVETIELEPARKCGDIYADLGIQCGDMETE